MKHKLLITVAAISLTLAGCGGGGGGGGSTAPAPAPVPTPTPPDANALQTSVSPGSYAAGSFELTAFTALNAARTAIGVGQLAESALLNQAAKNHADYLVARLQAGEFFSVNHTQSAGKSLFTGATPADRIAFAKYPALGSTEDLTSIVQIDGVQSVPGEVAINSLLSAPYHRLSLLDGMRDVGIGHAEVRLAGEGGLNHVLVTNAAIAQGKQAQLPAADWVGTWPADKATGVMYSFGGEDPNPIPTNLGACAGYPVSVHVRDGLILQTQTFTLVETVGGAAVSVQLSTKETDKNPLFARPHAAYIIPFKPLKLNTQYSARFVGSKNGVAIDKSWTFTTMGTNSKMIYGCDPS